MRSLWLRSWVQKTDQPRQETRSSEHHGSFFPSKGQRYGYNDLYYNPHSASQSSSLPSFSAYLFYSPMLHVRHRCRGSGFGAASPFFLLLVFFFYPNREMNRMNTTDQNAVIRPLPDSF